MTEAFRDSDVKAVFDAYPAALKPKLMRLRQLIFQSASKFDKVGSLEETLKWGQPSYLTSQSKSGTTVRIDHIKSAPGRYGMFVHCQTSLIATYRELYPDALTYDGSRGITFEQDEELPEEVVSHCIAMALTYHLDKRRDRPPF